MHQAHTVYCSTQNSLKASGKFLVANTHEPLLMYERYPKGGFHSILDALVKVGERFGVDYRFSTPVSQVNIDPRSGRATGVKLENGENLNADVVVVNADLVYAYNKLLPESSKAKSLSKKDASCASISFYCKFFPSTSDVTKLTYTGAMDTIIPQLDIHNVFLADDFRDSFDDIFKRQLIPKEPSFYIHVPTRIDKTAAPEGKDCVVVLVPCGHLLEGEATVGLDPKSKQDWEAMVSKARNAVLETLHTRLGVDLRPHIINEQINTPGTWKDKFNLDKGAILGLSHSFFNVLSFRPRTRHEKYKDLYFVGASTHPGTGVPIVLAGSKITTDQILEDRGMMKPWSPGVFKRRQVSPLDQEGARPFDLARTVVGLFVLLMLCIVYYYYSYRLR